jgi:hypothetical protein
MTGDAIQADQIRVRKVLGSRVYDLQNRKIAASRTWSSKRTTQPQTR